MSRSHDFEMPSILATLFTLCVYTICIIDPFCSQQVVMMMITQGGDEAVLHILNRTRELYRRRIQETAIVDQLDSIFVECAITEAQPLGHEPTSSTDLNGTRERVTADAHGNSILEKSVLV